MSSRKGLPHNPEAERSILGAILVDNRAYARVAGTLQADDFHDARHRATWAAIIRLVEDARAEVDFVTLRSELARTGDLERVGVAYLASLGDGVPKSVNVTYYAALVRDAANRRAVIDLANGALEAAYAGEQTAGEILAGWDNGSQPVISRLGDSSASLLRESSRAFFADMQTRAERGGMINGCPTGIPTLDLLTQGYQPGDMVVIAARPSMGKTALALTGLVGAVPYLEARRQRALVFSIEMRRQQLEYRLASMLSSVPLSGLLAGKVAPRDLPSVAEAMETIAGWPVVIDDRSALTIAQVRATCRQWHADGGLGVVLIDYLQLMSGNLTRKSANRYDELADISRRTKVLAGELGVPVILMAQLNRAGSKRLDRRPELSDIRDCGRVEEDTDIALLLHAKHHKEATRVVYLEKQRMGPTGAIRVAFEREIVRFADEGETDDGPDTPAPRTKRRAPSRPAGLPYAADE